MSDSNTTDLVADLSAPKFGELAPNIIIEPKRTVGPAPDPLWWLWWRAKREAKNNVPE